jgi:polysaccharide export outer membrane protein
MKQVCDKHKMTMNVEWKFPGNSFKRVILFWLVILSWPFSSCVSQRNVEYLQDKSKTIQSFDEPSLVEYSLKPNDELYIQISSLDSPASSIFSAASAQQIMNISTIQPYGASLISYPVNQDGYIFLPVIGLISVQGKTTAQVSEIIRQSLDKILNQPLVSVKLVNRYVSVLGEVKNPGHFSYSQDKLTIFDAIGLAGDITDYGDRDEVVLTRNENGKNLKIDVNLTRTDILASDCYYIRPNDMIYVKPMGKKFWGLREFPYNTLLSAITAGILLYSIVK